MFGVRIVAFAAALSGLAAAVPLDPAEAKPRYTSKGSYSQYLRKSHAKTFSRKAYAKHRATYSRKSYAEQRAAHSRKSYAKHRTRNSYSRNSIRKTYAYSGRKSTRKTYAYSSRNSSSQIRVQASAKASAGLGSRPSRWCGWGMRTQKGGGPELNLARNWKNWGRPSGPKVGAVVVWAHHVGIITGRAANGQWIVKSGNDGGRVRERPRSVAGAVF